MDRREFVESCSLAATASCLSAWPGTLALAADTRAHLYGRALLVDELGDPFHASRIKPRTNYIFHYPFVGTPVFLLDLGGPAAPISLKTRVDERYEWPGGVGVNKSLVAFSAICAHKLVYPTQDLSFISFRSGKAVNPGTPDAGRDVIHCCAEHSQYDPRQGARVVNGPAEQPLCAILLEHDPKADTLTAFATLGGELFDEFFRKYEFKLSLEVGPKARQAVAAKAVVRELERYCRNTIRC